MRRTRPARRTARTPRRWWRLALIGVGMLAGLAVLGIGVGALWAFAILPGSLPAVSTLETFQPSEGTRVYDDNDELVTEFHVERRIFTPLAQIPKHLKDAVLAVEDARFYSHFGIDVIGIARAVYANFRHGRIVEGGSTITQQLTKVLFLTPDRSLDRKLKEAVLAVELERRYSKDQILEMYLNQIYFGHGAFGVEAAARTYFGKSVRELSLAECALLAGLPKAPTTYSPFDRAEAAKRRRNTVLGRMSEVGFVNDGEARRASGSALTLLPPERRRTTGQYYMEYVQQYLEQQYGADLVFKGGLQVYTTLSPKMQLQAEQSLREGLKALETRRLKTAEREGVAPVTERPEGALLAVDPQTGYIKAMVGGYDFFKSEFNRAVQARRQPGSAFKPFVFLAALEAGLTPASVVDDSPISYAVGSAKPWKPDNYDRKFRGPITYQRALEESINVATVRVQERIGVRHTVDVARRLGVESPLHENLSIALGTSDLTLLEITSAYGTLANGGLWHRPTAIRHVLDGKGKLLEEYVPEGRQAISPELAYVMTHMMRGTIDRGTGAAAKALGRPAAAKTGTTQDYSNAWFIGFTPQLATGVWVGYDRPRSLGKDETGSRVAVPIWTAFMSQALAGQPVQDFVVPPGIVLATVDLDPSGSCGKPVAMAFIAGTEPKGPCGASRLMTTGGESPPPSAPLPAVETSPAPVTPPSSAVSPAPAPTTPVPAPRSSTIANPAPAAIVPAPTPLPRLIPAPTDPRRAAPVQTP